MKSNKSQSQLIAEVFQKYTDNEKKSVMYFNRSCISYFEIIYNFAEISHALEGLRGFHVLMNMKCNIICHIHLTVLRLWIMTQVSIKECIHAKFIQTLVTVAKNFSKQNAPFFN